MGFSGFSGYNLSAASYEGLSAYSGNAGIGNLNLNDDALQTWAQDYSQVWEQPFSTSPLTPDYQGDLLNSPAQGANATTFVFITPPGGVTFAQSADVNQVRMFGSNQPPLTVGGRNAGELSLSDALMEGFTLGKQVQQPLDNLLEMQKVQLDTKGGFVNVPVYKVFAGQGVGAGKEYGNYIIENISIDENLRDTSGRLTRAMVAVSFKQVGAYQINTGIDQGANPNQQLKPPTQTSKQDAAVAAANAQGTTPAR